MINKLLEQYGFRSSSDDHPPERSRISKFNIVVLSCTVLVLLLGQVSIMAPSLSPITLWVNRFLRAAIPRTSQPVYHLVEALTLLMVAALAGVSIARRRRDRRLRGR
jgi:hypothetical protein